MKKFGIAFMNCLIAVVSTSQYEYFNNVYSVEIGNDAITQNIEYEGEEYYLLGQFLNAQNQFDVAMLTLNNEGEQLDTTVASYGFYEYTHYADSFRATTDGNFLWGGTYTDVDGYHAVLSKFNAEFGILWSYDYVDSELADFQGCVELIDGYLGYGTIIVNENNDINDDYGNLLVTKLSLDGSLLWQQVISVFNQERFVYSTKIFECPNGDLIVFGSRYYDWDYFAIKLDSLGNYISEYTWGSPLNDWLPWPVDLGNGEFMVAWQESHYYYQEGEPGTPVSTPHLKKFDANSMTEIWDIEFESDSLYVGYTGDLIRSADGGFLICGSNNRWIEGDDLVQSGFFLKVDSIGDKEWLKHYDHLSQDPIFEDLNYAYDAELTNDQGYVACGTFEEDAMGLQQIWIFKTDCMGNLELPPISFEPQINQVNDSTFLCMSGTENVYDVTWNFGNGDVVVGDTVTYVYNTIGSFEISISGHYCVMDFDSTFSVNVTDCMGNISTPALELNAEAEQVSDSTFLFSSTPENLENITWFFPDGEIVANEVQYSFPDTGTFAIEVCGWYCDSLVCTTLEIIISTGLYEYSKDNGAGLIISPNPSNDFIYLNAQSNIQHASIKDLTGRLVITTHPNTKSCRIDVSSLPYGTYLVEASFEGALKETVKLVVDRE